MFSFFKTTNCSFIDDCVILVDTGDTSDKKDSAFFYTEPKKCQLCFVGY